MIIKKKGLNFIFFAKDKEDDPSLSLLFFFFQTFLLFFHFPLFLLFFFIFVFFKMFFYYHLFHFCTLIFSFFFFVNSISHPL